MPAYKLRKCHCSTIVRQQSKAWPSGCHSQWPSPLLNSRGHYCLMHKNLAWKLGIPHLKSQTLHLWCLLMWPKVMEKYYCVTLLCRWALGPQSKNTCNGKLAWHHRQLWAAWSYLHAAGIWWLGKQLSISHLLNLSWLSCLLQNILWSCSSLWACSYSLKCGWSCFFVIHAKLQSGKFLWSQGVASACSFSDVCSLCDAICLLAFVPL